MSIVLFLLFGLVVGLIARAIMPGRQSMSLPITVLLGCVGSLVGGFLSALFTHRKVTDFDTAGIIGSILGALVVLFVYTRVVAGKRPLTR